MSQTSSSSRKSTVLLAEDHSLVAEGIRLILEPTYDLLEIVSDGAQLIERCRELRPEVVIADISMPRMNGIEALREIKKEAERTRVLMLTGSADVNTAVEAFRAGASGYVLKHAAPTELTTALAEVMEGRTYVTPRIANDVLQRLMDPSTKDDEGPSLTSRERQVLQLIAEGRSSKEAAGVLKVAPRTVEFHKRNVMNKTGLRTTAELARYASSIGLVSDPKSALNS